MRLERIFIVGILYAPALIAISQIGYQRAVLTPPEKIIARVIAVEEQSPQPIPTKITESSSTFLTLQKELNRINSTVTADAKKIDVSKNSIIRYASYDKQIAAVDVQYAQQESALSEAEKNELDRLYRATSQTLANAVMSLAITALKKVQERIVEHVNDVRMYIIGAASQQSFLEQLAPDDQDFAAFVYDADDIVALCNNAIIQENNILFMPELYLAASDTLKQECQTLLVQLLSDSQTETRSFYAIVRVWHMYFSQNFNKAIKSIDPIRAQTLVQFMQEKVLHDVVESITTVWQLMLLLAAATDTFPLLAPIDVEKGLVMQQDIYNILNGLAAKKVLQKTTQDAKRAELLAQSKKHLLTYKRTMNDNAFAIWQRELERIIEPLNQYDARAAQQIRALITERKKEWAAYQKPAGFERQHQLKKTEQEQQKKVAAFMSQLKSIEEKLTALHKTANRSRDQHIDYSVYDQQLYELFAQYQTIESTLSDQQVNQIAIVYRTVSVQLSTMVIEQALQTIQQVLLLGQEQIAVIKKMCAADQQVQQNFLNTYQAHVTARADEIKKIIQLVRTCVLQEKNLTFSESVMQHASQEQSKKLADALIKLIDGQSNATAVLSHLLSLWHQYSTQNLAIALKNMPLIKRNSLKKSVGGAINDTIIEPLAALIIDLVDAIEGAQLPIDRQVLQTDILYNQLLEVEQTFAQESATKKTLESLHDVVDQEQRELTQSLDRLLQQAFPANQTLLDAWLKKAQQILTELIQLDPLVGDNYKQRVDRYYTKGAKKITPTIVIKPALK